MASLSPDEIRAQRKREVALGYRILAAQRWGDLGDGHISARDPERTDCFWLLRYGVSYHAARVSDLVLVGPPKFFWRTTLRPRGPRVTLTASASLLTPRRIACRQTSE